MTATLQLQGSLTLQAPSFPPSAAQQIAQPISESFYVSEWDPPGSVSLIADGQISLPFPPGMTLCHFLYIKVQGSPITLYITSADGAAQAIPVDSLLILEAIGVPMTALAVARTPGATTTLTYMIAQHA